MSNKYYYLVSSLPQLILGEVPAITSKGFLSECEKWLSTNDFYRISSIDIDNMEIALWDLPIARQWKQFDMALRVELADIRSKRQKDSHEAIPGSLKDIFEQKNPLLMEKAIIKKKWDFLEECEFGNHFDMNFLALYFLKLQILERMAEFDKTKGKAVFESLCNV